VLHAPPPLPEWEAYYLIIGTSAAALTGLNFVVIALGSETTRIGGDDTVKAFGTPTMVHFCVVILLSAIATAPWQSLSAVALVLGATGLAGVAYSGFVVRQAQQQTSYTPEPSDWFWHGVLPPVCYAALVVAALLISRHAHEALFVVAAVALLLTYIGIHNAWDSATYIALSASRDARERDRAGSRTSSPD